ncbi:MAG: eukaryotic-like serine/threonine-protein kinase [Blastocatellia bacterium]|jgi:serine/threonine protein kinase|nr:eukaryotic-like serine/threonine-protein kinase [Blastocatellia bacterium]
MIAPDTLLQNRYLVQKQIGQGGMGAVYVATDQRFGSTVALKETFFDDANLRKAFEREARLLNHLRHPALPRVSDHFAEEDGQFLVMEFIPGADLSEMLKEKSAPFPAHDVLEWADQLLDALDYLHNHEPSIIHRDIKPQNLKLTTRNHIVLLDFGLAKGAPLQASRVTATGSLFGYSFNYAPLEQMQGTGTDPRSDLYSLGATVYHLLTNVTPPDALTRATAMVNGEPDPLRPANEVHAQVSAPVARVLMSAMAQSAAKRPPTAAAMREALSEASKQDAASLPTVMQLAAGVVANAPEQDTQLLGAQTEILEGEAATNIKAAGSVAGLHEAATLLQPSASASNPSPVTNRNRDDESIVTKVRAAETNAPRRRLSTRSLVAALVGIVLLSGAALALYKFTQQPAPQSQGVQPAPTATGAATPAPTVTTPAEAQHPAPLPSPAAAPAAAPNAAATTQQQPVKPPIKVIIRKHDKSGSGENAPPDEMNNDVPDEMPETPDTPNHPGMSPEERARVAADIRRARQAMREAERQRRDALRGQQNPRAPKPKHRVPPPPY